MVQRLKQATDLVQWREQILAQRDDGRRIVSVCVGTGCKAYECDLLVQRLQQGVQDKKLDSQVQIKPTGCPGFCERGTLVIIEPGEILYQKVTPEDADEIIEKTLQGGEVIERLLYHDAENKPVERMSDIPFYRYQQQLLMGNNRKIDPNSIEDYVALGGYSALRKALETMKPEDVLHEVEKAHLRGRGGGGFEAGRKWRSTFEAQATPKYVLCNADEGDPGAFMDRALLEGNPHSVIEGMLLGAYAIGASKGFIYVRNEYPLAVENAGIAITQAKEAGLLGDNILGSGFSFDLKINRGGGAFVCGESTALMLSIEGRVGEPRAKHIHTAVSGLYNLPTNLNNVETWANVPLIVNNGADWYAKIGTDNSPGTKIFALVGKVNNTGLVEIPMGMTLRDIIFKIGGGILHDKPFKSIQTGGPSGGCLPSDSLDLPVDFDRLWDAGSMMGSGGMIVMDENTCMVDVARYFLGFLKFESCGKCSTCREGVRRLYELVDKITRGEGVMEDLDLIEELSETVIEASLCALGGTAPNPVLSTLRYFREEYEEHILQKKCRAKVCKPLLTFTIDPEACTGCLICARKCPEGAISGKKQEVHVSDQDKCTQCGICLESCPDKFNAVRVE